MNDLVETGSILSIPISVRSRFGKKKFRILSVATNMLAYGDHVLPFDEVEWASCTGDGVSQSVLLIKTSRHSRPHGLIFATTEQRDLVTARLAEWNEQKVHQTPGSATWWSSGSSESNAPRGDWPRGGDPWQGRAPPAAETAAEGWPSRHWSSSEGSQHGDSHYGDSRHGNKGGDAWYASGDEDETVEGSCCVRIREDGVCLCRFGCCHCRMQSCGKGLLRRAESAFGCVQSIVKKRSLEIGIFGLLMPLALALALYLWTLKQEKTYNRAWLPAECTIQELEVQTQRLYMHGDYLRNSHPNDGVYFVLQPAWRSIVKPLPVPSFYTRDRKACCRQAHAQAQLPASIDHVERTPMEPWFGLTFDDVSPGAAQGCKGSIAVSLQETFAICNRNLYWTLPNQVMLNHTYPCWYVAHGASHVYLNVQPEILALASADIAAIILLVIAIISLAALVSSHPAIEPRLWACCYRSRLGTKARENGRDLL